MTIKIDWTTTGIMNITDASDQTLKAITLANVSSTAQNNNTVFISPLTNRTGMKVVAINGIENPDDYVIDIRDVQGTPYATTQDLVDDILAHS